MRRRVLQAYLCVYSVVRFGALVCGIGRWWCFLCVSIVYVYDIVYGIADSRVSLCCGSGQSALDLF